MCAGSRFNNTLLYTNTAVIHDHSPHTSYVLKYLLTLLQILLVKVIVDWQKFKW